MSECGEWSLGRGRVDANRSQSPRLSWLCSFPFLTSVFFCGVGLLRLTCTESGATKTNIND